MLYSWLQQPHVREFYQRRAPTWDDVRERYLRRLAPEWPTKCFLIHADKPIGYIQTYRIADWPECTASIGESHGISVDLLIGEGSYVGNGWGRLVLLKFLDEIAFPLFAEEEVCWILHDKLNGRALRASRAAGFEYLRDVVDHGTPHALFVLNKQRAGGLVSTLGA
jgi:hypothetical protein